jgi:hypothetical protein
VGYSHHLLYNSNTKGFRPKTFGALVDGIVEAVGRAHADLAPSTLVLSHGELHDASVNRSPLAFARNPAAERAFFPDAIDPQTTLLRRSPPHASTSEVTVSWDIPPGARPGRYRIRYQGDARDAAGVLHPFHGESPGLDVAPTG